MSADDAVLGRLAAVAEAVAADPARRHPLIVLIDGRSGAGKSTLARALVSDWPIAGERPQLVRLDDLYPGWGGLLDGSRMVLEQLIEPRVAGRPAGWRSWDWKADEPAAWNVVDPASPLVIEGCGAISAVASVFADLSIWVETDAVERKRRALSRDGDTFARHWEMWAEQEVEFAASEHPELLADLVVSGDSLMT